MLDAPGVDDVALVTELQGRFLAAGLVATSIRQSVEQNLAASQSFFRLMQGFLALGLLVGIIGLGVVMVRAVRERRRTIGVLRALGFRAKAVERAFMAESTFVAAEGILIGAVARGDHDLSALQEQRRLPGPARARTRLPGAT